MSNKLKVGDVGTFKGKTGFWKIIEENDFTIGIENISDTRDRVRIETSDFSLTEIKFTVVDMTDSNKIKDYINSNKVLVDYVSSLKSEIEELEKRLSMLETSTRWPWQYTFDEIKHLSGNYKVVGSITNDMIHINEFGMVKLISDNHIYETAEINRKEFKYIKMTEDITITFKAL